MFWKMSFWQFLFSPSTLGFKNSNRLKRLLRSAIWPYQVMPLRSTFNLPISSYSINWKKCFRNGWTRTFEKTGRDWKMGELGGVNLMPHAFFTHVGFTCGFFCLFWAAFGVPKSSSCLVLLGRTSCTLDSRRDRFLAEFSFQLWMGVRPLSTSS